MPRNRTFTEKEIKDIIRMKVDGVAIAQIAKQIGRSESAIYNVLGKHKDDVALTQRDKQEKVVAASTPQVFKVAGQEKSGEQAIKEKAEELKPTMQQPAVTPAMDVQVPPSGETTYGMEHNAAVKLFMEATQDALGKMKVGMADQMFHQFMQDLELVPVLQSIRAQHKLIYEKKNWSFATFLQAAANMLAFQVNRVENVFPAPDTFLSPDKKSFDMGELMKVMMTMKMLENL